MSPTDNEEDTSPISDEEWEAGETEEENEEELEPVTESMGQKALSGESFRVSEDIGKKIPVWTGVSSCCRSSRGFQEARAHITKWHAATIANHPENVAVATGYSGKTWCKKKRYASGKRRCKGGVRTLTVYVDFAGDGA